MITDYINKTCIKVLFARHFFSDYFLLIRNFITNLQFYIEGNCIYNKYENIIELYEYDMIIRHGEIESVYIFCS